MNKITIILIFIMALAFNRMNSKVRESYNDGYREGMLYAYDNVVVCGASPEAEGLNMARVMGRSTVSDIECGE